MVALALLLSALTLTDDVGRTVTLAARPERIVSTAPSNTELLFALGAGDRVVGVTTQCVDPPEAKTRTKVGDFSTLDLERVLALRPDLVVATWLEQRRTVERMEALGLPVLVLFPESFADTMRSIERLGEAIGAADQATALVRDMRRRLAAIDRRTAAVLPARRPRTLVLLGLSPLYTAGPGSTVDEAIARAGGMNIAADLGKPYGVLSREVVIERDPEVVILGMGAGTKADFARMAGFGGVSAIASGRVIEGLDPGLLFHHSHRLVDGVETLFRILHGERDGPPASGESRP